jgi:hypothetical protein
MDAARRVPGGATGKFVAFEQDDIVPAKFRQMIQHAAPDDATTNHGDPNM